MRHRRLKVTLSVLVLSGIMLVGCGDDNDVSCGVGTLPQSGRCVPAPELCQTGYVWRAGACVAELTCAEGTRLNAAGTACVLLSDPCPEGQAWAGGECVPRIACAGGTTLVEGACVPDLELCGDGRLWDGTSCVAPVRCEEGTTADSSGNCIPEDDLCPPGHAWVGGECVERSTCAEGTTRVGDLCVPAMPTLFAETFETWLPAGWVVENNGVAGAGEWQGCTPGGSCYATTVPWRFAPASGGYAAADSWENRSEPMDTELVSPPIELAAVTSAELSFASLFWYGSSGIDFGEVGISADDGATCQPLHHLEDEDTPGAGESLTLDLDEYAGGTVRIRFRYVGDRDYFWLIDEVVVRGE
jgi:hypothetical protein